MDSYSAISSEFEDSISQLALSADELATGIEALAALFADIFVGDRKVLISASGPARAPAILLEHYLLHGYQQDRPGFSVVCLSHAADDANLEPGSSQARQIKALGQDGDLLLCLYAGQSAWHLALQRAARERGMQIAVIGLSAHDPALAETSIDEMHISLSTGNRARAIEQLTLIVHCTCATLDQFLFGGSE